MYAFHVSDLIAKKEHSSESSDGDSYSSDDTDDIRALILKRLEKQRDTPQRQYLMQCADWYESEFNKGTWIAYSLIENRYGGYWTLYDLDGLSYADDENNARIEFHSWKGDYEPQKFYMPSGNLPYCGKERRLQGTVWTRGE